MFIRQNWGDLIDCVQSILGYLTPKISYKLFLQELSLLLQILLPIPREFRNGTSYFIHCNQKASHFFFFLQHKLVTRVTSVIEEHETLTKSTNPRHWLTPSPWGSCLFQYKWVCSVLFKQNILCLSYCEASYAASTSIKISWALRATRWSVRLPWPSVLFVPCMPDARLLYALSSPSEHSVPPCGHILSCSPALLLFSCSATKCNRHSYWAGHRSSRPCVSGRFPKQRCISSHRKITNG